MYYCYKIMLQDFQIDTLEAEGINNSGYIRMIYNGNSFFFSHHYLKSNREEFNTIRCFNEQNIIYFVAKKICAGNYLICWIGDGESLELRNNYTPNSIKKEALKTVIICALTSALFYFFNKANSEVISVILICFISLFVPFSLVFLYAFIDSLKSSSRQIKKLLDLDLLHSTGFFVPLDSLERTTECPLLEKLPNELQSLDGIVQSAFRKTKTVHKSSYCATTETSFDDSYTKVMLYITVNDKTHAFEYKEEKSSDALSCTRIPPFVVEGDDVTLYWYQGHLEDIPTDSITGLNGKRLICLYNRTSNTLFKSRQNITPKLPNKIPILGGRGDYNTYRKF